MKKLILMVVCTSIFTVGGLNVYAHQPLPMEKMPPRHEMKMKGPKDFAKELGLTDEQKLLAEKVREEGRKKMEPLMQERKVLHDKMETIRKENMAEFEKILTPEQKEKFEDIRKKHMKRKGKFGRNLMANTEDVKK